MTQYDCQKSTYKSWHRSKFHIPTLKMHNYVSLGQLTTTLDTMLIMYTSVLLAIKSNFYTFYFTILNLTLITMCNSNKG